MRNIWVPALACGAVASGSFVGALSAEVNPPFRPAGLEAHDSHASASLLGQFRTTLSGWLFLRADLYLHNGVEMRPLTSGEVRAGRTGVGGSDDGHEKLHDDSKIVTVIPMARDDFRGWIGDIERAVSAHKDMKGHDHNDPKTTLPLFRLMTWLDPQFTVGWTTGGMIMARDRTPEGTKRVVAYLQEGLRHNPKSIDISQTLGYIVLTRQGQLREAIPLFDQAREVGWANREHLSEAEREALLQSYRWLSLCYRDTFQFGPLKDTVAEGLSLFPDDPLLLRQKHRPISILNRKGVEAWAKELSERMLHDAEHEESHHH